MSHRRLALGRRGEDYAAKRLEARGWKIRTRNWRCPVGEIDIVAERGSERIFVEVRTRRADGILGTPEESVDVRKRLRLRALAQSYLMQHPWPGACRIDVVAIEVSPDDRVLRFNHVKNAAL